MPLYCENIYGIRGKQSYGQLNPMHCEKELLDNGLTAIMQSANSANNSLIAVKKKLFI